MHQHLQRRLRHLLPQVRLRLNYNGVIGMLVEAVKELRAEVKELKEAM